MVGLDRLLSHIGEHRICAAKGDDRHLAVESRNHGENVLRPEHDEQEGERAQPKRQARGRDSEEAGE